MPDSPLDTRNVWGSRQGQNCPAKYLWDPTSQARSVSGGAASRRARKDSRGLRPSRGGSGEGRMRSRHRARRSGGHRTAPADPARPAKDAAMSPTTSTGRYAPSAVDHRPRQAIGRPRYQSLSHSTGSKPTPRRKSASSTFAMTAGSIAIPPTTPRKPGASSGSVPFALAVTTKATPVRSTNVRNTGTSRRAPEPCDHQRPVRSGQQPGHIRKGRGRPPRGLPLRPPGGPGTGPGPVAGQIAWEGDVDGSGGR